VPAIPDHFVLMPLQIKFRTLSNRHLHANIIDFAASCMVQKKFLSSQVKFTESDITFLFYFLQGVSFIAAPNTAALSHRKPASLYLKFEELGRLKNTLRKPIHLQLTN
jgi:hypothetical protein